MEANKWTLLQEEYKDLFVKEFWGFEVPDTWYPVIKVLLEKSKWDADKNRAPVLFTQIKEKFGGLRAYYIVDTEKDVSPDAMRLIDENIAYCEALVDHTCVKCGTMHMGMKCTSGWISRMCLMCAPELYEEL